MPDLVAIARKRILEMERELVELRAFVATADRLAGKLAADAHQAPPRTRTSSTTVATIQAVTDALNEAGRPLQPKQLLGVLMQRGVPVGGKNPASTLSARLSNSGIFKSHGGLGWWFKDREIPGHPSMPLVEESASPHSEGRGDADDIFK